MSRFVVLLRQLTLWIESKQWRKTMSRRSIFGLFALLLVAALTPIAQGQSKWSRVVSDDEASDVKGGICVCVYVDAYCTGSFNAIGKGVEQCPGDAHWTFTGCPEGMNGDTSCLNIISCQTPCGGSCSGTRTTGYTDCAGTNHMF
jgi:hypothetical protein